MTAKLTAVFAAVSLTVCIFRAATKPVVITGAVQAQEQTQGTAAPLEETYDARVLTLVPISVDGAADDLTIPLPVGMRSEDVRMENHYLSRQLWITLRTSRGNYDKEGVEISADEEKVREGVSVRTERTSISLRFGLTGLYEPMIQLSDGVLHVQLQTPKEAYRRVVLVDPVPVAEAGTADVTLAVAQAFAARYDEDGATRVYLTRMDDAENEDQTVLMLQETQADLCIRLFDGADGLRTVYNDTWYLRRYTNAEFARDLAAEIAGAAGIGIAKIAPVGRADPVLAVCEVPGAAVSLDRAAVTSSDASDAVARIAQGMQTAVEMAFSAIAKGEASE